MNALVYFKFALFADNSDGLPLRKKGGFHVICNKHCATVLGRRKQSTNKYIPFTLQLYHSLMLA